MHHCNSSFGNCTPFLTQILHVLINKQWFFYFHCYTALIITKVIVQNNNNHVAKNGCVADYVNQWTMYFARWHYHLPVCPSRFWFIERLLGAARPLTFASLPKKNQDVNNKHIALFFVRCNVDSSDKCSMYYVHDRCKIMSFNATVLHSSKDLPYLFTFASSCLPTTCTTRTLQAPQKANKRKFTLLYL